MKQEKLPVWDLSFFYKGADDPKINLDLKKNLVEAIRFAKKFKTRVHTLDEKQLLTAILQLEKIFIVAIKPIDYAQELFSTDSITPANGVLLQRATDHYLAVRGELFFFDLELIELPLSHLKTLANSKTLANYRHYLLNLIKLKPHHLTESEERIFNDKYATGAAAFNRLFDQHFSTKRFKLDVAGTVREVTESEILESMTKPDRKLRAAAAKSLTQGLASDKQMLGLIYNTIVKDKAIYDKWHKFDSPEASQHLSNEIDQKTVDAMAETVQKSYGVVADFYNFKRKVMKLPKFEVYDRYAPISKTDRKYSFGEAKKIIIQAFRKFSQEFANTAQKFFDEKWIHAPVVNGKRGGAYCAYNTPDTHPVVFVNFQGTARDVQTLAHELGHGINAYMMRKQSLLNYETPLILAETASVFGEMLVFDDLKETITDPKDRFAMYIEKIQDIFSTVFRQTAMYKFEQDFHKLQKQKGELTVDEINSIWIKRQNEMYQGAVDNSGSEQWWSYIPHFLHTPFYVYAYSFGELLVLSLYAQYKKNPKMFVPKYLEMMSVGSSKTPQEILKPFGINLSDRKFWEGGIRIIQELVAETKEIYKQI